MAQTQFGRFEIRSLLGKGAMGAVYLAHDPTLKREVAIKLVRFPERIDSVILTELKQGLMKEARMAARLSHPGIVQVYDVGEEKGVPFLVLELIKGTPLSDLLKDSGNIETANACHVFKELLSAMAYAHQKGVVHLDLKPANIMIGKNWQPRIMDFGIARSVAELREQDIDISGTPRYMAPEQIMGEKLDTRADVFSLGVIFYLLMSGNLPFPYEDFDRLRHVIVNKPHPPLQNHIGELPKSYYEFVDRALDKRPTDRFESAVSMLESFVKCLEGKSKNRENSQNADMNENSRQEILQFIMQRMERKGDFPAVSQYVSEVVNAARSPNSSAQKIAQSILNDISLTNKVLRIANSAYYQGLGSPITTISRAVVVLGTEAILNMTSALGIFEHFLKGPNVRELKKQVVEALFTALNARAIANQIGMENAEEPFICGMLHHLGRLIVCFYFNEEQEAIEKLIYHEGMDDEQASRKIMRLSYMELGQAIAEAWKLPKLLQSGLKELDPDKKGPLKDKASTLRGITSYAYALSKVTMITDKKERQVALANLARQFEGKIEIKPKMLKKIMADSVENAAGFSNTLKLSLKELGLVEQEQEQEKTVKSKNAAAQSADETVLSIVTNDTVFQTLGQSVKDDSLARAVSAAVESDSPQDANAPPDYMVERQEFLTKTIADIAMTLTGQFSLSDIIMMVLEGMYRGLAMRNVLLAMVTPKRDRLVFRFGLGPETEQLRMAFDFPLKSLNEAPVFSVLKQQEVVIFDLDKNPHDYLIPKKLIHLMDPKSIAFLPVVVKKKPIGLFLAMRSKDQISISDMELQSVRMLVNQAVLALHQSAMQR